MTDAFLLATIQKELLLRDDGTDRLHQIICELERLLDKFKPNQCDGL